MPSYWIEIQSESQFSLTRAGAYEELLGRKHTFKHGKRTVTVSLPSKTAIENRKKELRMPSFLGPRRLM